MLCVLINILQIILKLFYYDKIKFTKIKWMQYKEFNLEIDKVIKKIPKEIYGNITR